MNRPSTSKLLVALLSTISLITAIVPTAAEVIPAVQLDRRLIGNGQPGPVTLKLIASFRELTRTTGTPIYE